MEASNISDNNVTAPNSDKMTTDPIVSHQVKYVSIFNNMYLYHLQKSLFFEERL